MTISEPSGETLPLFDDDPPPSAPNATPAPHLDTPASLSTTLARTAPRAGGPVNKARLAFERLVASVEQARDELRQWQQALERYRSRRAAEVETEAARLRVEQRQMASFLDALLGDDAPPQGARLGRVQRGKLRRLLIELVTALLDEGDDPALVAIHDRHAGVGHAEARAVELAATQAMLEETFDIDLGDTDGAATADALIERAGERLREREAAEQQARDARRAARARAKAAAASSAGPGSAAARPTREARAEEASRSMRDVYRQLASALHPDREPDAAERGRKTKAMQRVNDAYAANDLLALLELQLELERFDPSRLGALSEQRLGHYSRVLRDQLRELEAEIESFRAPFDAEETAVVFGFAVGGALPSRRRREAPATIVDRRIALEVAGLRAVRETLERDRVAFQDPARLREALRHMATDRAPALPDDEVGAAAMPAFAEETWPPPPASSTRRRGKAKDGRGRR